MTYNVFSRTLNPTQSINQSEDCLVYSGVWIELQFMIFVCLVALSVQQCGATICLNCKTVTLIDSSSLTLKVICNGFSQN